MKNTLLYLLGTLMSFGLTAQDLPKNDSGEVEYTEVIVVDSASADQLYTAAKLWFAESFKDANEVLQVQDKEAGELLGKGLFYIPTNRFGYTAIGLGFVRFQISISVKDGRYKYSFSNFIHEGGKQQIYDCGPLDNEKPTVCSKKIFIEVKEKTNDQINNLIESLKSSMTKAGKAEDW